jgi:CheY-like chemotaxis protein
MDMQMPVLDGIGSTKKIREYEKNNQSKKPVYIVAVTANAFSEDKRKCMEAGMDDFISKPFKVSELQEIIKNAVKNN